MSVNSPNLDDLSALFSAPISDYIWRTKYKAPQDETLAHTFARVTKAVVGGTASAGQIGACYRAMCNGEFAPAGRILAGAGLDRNVTLINCFVSPTIEDSMRTEINRNSKGIMSALHVAALTQQMGGGIGMNFNLRPKGAMVQSVGVDASGNLPFMDMWNAMCATVMSAGSRRGAMMATMHVSHPDILDFIDAKKLADRLTNFNVSVLVTDAFMDAVQNDLQWDLVFPVPAFDRTLPQNDNGDYVYATLPARELWERITRTTFEYSEPGVIFIDRVNKLNNLNYCEHIMATNPCGEQPLPPNSDCNLGAINLAAFVRPAHNGQSPSFDFLRLRSVVEIAVDFLDLVIDVTKFPTPEQEEEARQKRRIGLGITGLATALQLMHLQYGSSEGRGFAASVMQVIANTAYHASSQLAKRLGAFPAYNKAKFRTAPFMQCLDDEVRLSVEKWGIRNGVLLTIAPTGTTSLLFGNVSSGCEPVFSHVATRNILQPDGSHKSFEVWDYGYKLWWDQLREGELVYPPSHFVTAHGLSVEQHVLMQAALQQWVDSSISKTINCPKDMSYEDFKQVYWLAYANGCKGCTTYRPSDVRGAVLEIADTKSDTPVKVHHDDDEAQDDVAPAPVKEVERTMVPQRPEQLTGTTYKVRWPSADHAHYVTINDFYDEDIKAWRPFEIFINSKDVKHHEWIAALTRTVSAIFRRGGSIDFLIDELEQVHSQNEGFFIERKYVPSLVSLIANTIRKHVEALSSEFAIGVKVNNLNAYGFNTPSAQSGLDYRDPVKSSSADKCPKCRAPSLVRKEGCESCESCDYSRCG